MNIEQKLRDMLQETEINLIKERDEAKRKLLEYKILNPDHRKRSGHEPDNTLLLDEIMGMSHYQDELLMEIKQLKATLEQYDIAINVKIPALIRERDAPKAQPPTIQPGRTNNAEEFLWNMYGQKAQEEITPFECISAMEEYANHKVENAIYSTTELTQFTGSKQFEEMRAQMENLTKENYRLKKEFKHPQPEPIQPTEDEIYEAGKAYSMKAHGIKDEVVIWAFNNAIQWYQNRLPKNK